MLDHPGNPFARWVNYSRGEAGGGSMVKGNHNTLRLFSHRSLPYGQIATHFEQMWKVCSSKDVRFINLAAALKLIFLRNKNLGFDINGVHAVNPKQRIILTCFLSGIMALTGQASAQIRQSGGQPGSSISA